MNWLLLLGAAVVLLFGFVVAFGAPYLPTLQAPTQTALDLLELQPGQLLLELGCGDGRVAKAAAQRGIRVRGYELNPLLFVVALLNTRKFRHLVTIRWGNYWTADWPPADAVFVFLLDRYMPKLDKKLTQQKAKHNAPFKLLSYTFKVPGKRPVRQRQGLYLYHY